MSKVAIVGSRDYPRCERVSAIVRGLPAGTVILTGDARGVDEAAERAARAFGFKVQVFRVDATGLPDDETERRIGYARRAYERNTKLVEAADEVVAFWTVCARPQCYRPQPHKTHGTAHAITEAQRLRRPVQLIGPKG